MLDIRLQSPPVRLGLLTLSCGLVLLYVFVVLLALRLILTEQCVYCYCTMRQSQLLQLLGVLTLVAAHLHDGELEFSIHPASRTHRSVGGPST